MLRPREEYHETRRKQIKKYLAGKKKRIRELKTKGMIAGALILWGLSAVNLCINTWNRYDQEENVVNAFAEENYSNLTAEITANGYFGNMEITETAKYIILEEIADRIGINRYEITSDSGTTSLTQKSVNGAVELKFVTISQETEGQTLTQNQYLCMRIHLNHSIEAAETYRTILQDVIDEYDIKTSVNVNLSGIISGELTQEDQKQLKTALMKKIGASVQVEAESDGVYMVYGYDKDIDSYIKMGHDKVNVNLTVSYDEKNDQTLIHMATPINNEDY